MKPSSKWLCSVCFLAVLCLALASQAEAGNPSDLSRQGLQFKPPTCDGILGIDKASGYSQAVVNHLRVIASVISPYLPSGEAERTVFELFSHFPTIGAMLSATPQELSYYGLDNRAADVLHSLHGLFIFMREEQILDREVLSGWNEVLDYLHARYRHNQSVEEFAVLFLDRKNKLISIDALAQGTVDHVPVYPREVARLSLLKNASAIILVHNHPSGDPAPSSADISMTAEIVNALSTLGIVVHDHIIVGRDSEVSMRALGYL